MGSHCPNTRGRTGSGRPTASAGRGALPAAGKAAAAAAVVQPPRRPAEQPGSQTGLVAAEAAAAKPRVAEGNQFAALAAEDDLLTWGVPGTPHVEPGAGAESKVQSKTTLDAVPAGGVPDDLDTSLDRQKADDLRSDLQAIDKILSEIGGRGSYAYQSTVAMRAWAFVELAALEAVGY